MFNRAWPFVLVAVRQIYMYNDVYLRPPILFGSRCVLLCYAVECDLCACLTILTACAYREMTDEPWRIDVLAAITTRRAAEMHASSSEGRGGATHIGGRGDGGGSSDMLVVHLRLGDVLGQSGSDAALPKRT